MPAVFKNQSNFNLGEADKSLFSAIDWEGYYKTLRKARNVVGTPRRGMLKRFGLAYEASLSGISDISETQFFSIRQRDDQVYLIVMKPEVLEIWFDGVLQQTLVTPYLAATMPKIKRKKLTTSMVFVSGDFALYELAPVTLPNVWTFTMRPLTNQPTFDFDGGYDAIDFTPSATSGTVTIDASAPIFTPAMVGGIFEGNGGIVRIETFVSNIEITGTTIEDFLNTDDISGEVVSLREPIFSDTRGWPKTIGFSQERLVLAANDTLPSIVTFSKTGDFFNFDEGMANDDDAIVQITTELDNEIVQIYDAQALVLFGNEKLLSTPVTYEVPITPTNIYFAEAADAYGAASVEPWKIDNKILYVDDGKTIVRGLDFSLESSDFREDSVSAISPQLIRNPVESERLVNPTNNDSVFYFLINEDGTLAIYHSLASQNVGGWTLAESPGADGKFRRITGDGDEVWFIMERTIDGQQVFYIEKADFSFYTDASFRFELGAPSTTVTGLDALEGQEVWVRGDNYVLENETVTGGQIEISRASTMVEVGLPFAPQIVPMPPNVQTQSGNDIYFKKRIVSLYVDYIDSLGITVQGIEIPQLKFSPNFFPDQPPEPQDGVAEITIFDANWWDPRAEILITQNAPLPFHLIGLGMEIQSEELEKLG